MGKCKNCGLKWRKHSPSDKEECRRRQVDPCCTCRDCDPCAPGINACGLHISKELGGHIHQSYIHRVRQERIRQERQEQARRKRTHLRLLERLLFFYYVTWFVVFGYGTRFVFNRLQAADHLTGLTIVDWITIPVFLGTFILWLAYMIKHMLR